MIQRNPPGAGLEFAPTGDRAFPLPGLRYRERPFAGEFAGPFVIRAGAFSDIQVRDADLHFKGRLLPDGLCLSLSAELVCDFIGQFTKSGIEPVTRAGFVSEPPMDRDDHLVCFRRIVQAPVLISEPDQFLLAIAPADVHTELH